MVDDNREGFGDNLNFTIELIKKHALGAVRISPTFKDSKRVMDSIKEAADYPTLILTDAESGLGDYKIGRHNSISPASTESTIAGLEVLAGNYPAKGDLIYDVNFK